MVENRFVLFGDGIHDDHAAIQEMLDSHRRVIYLPQPAVHYLITKTLYICSNQTLVLPEQARIKLADNSCVAVLPTNLIPISTHRCETFNLFGFEIN